MNQFLCESWAAFHKAIPFQNNDQIRITISNHIGKPSINKGFMQVIIAKIG
ncbi:MAG: hypothetical protein V4690_02575 [Patescibacteria group bacterium]